MATSQTQRDAIRISDSDPQVVLHPNDDDLFVRTGQQVIAACSLDISIELWIKEINSMLAEVAKWAAARADRVRMCYCWPRGTRTVLFFVPASKQFDFDLADELVVLGDELIKKFNVGMVELHQIPETELDRFLNRESARRVYGPEPAAHQPVET